MNTKTKPVDQQRDPEAVASFVVGMAAHTVAHAHLKSDSRQGKLQKTVSIWTERAQADPAMVKKALERLAADPMAWDAVGSQSSALYNKKLALQAVQDVVDSKGPKTRGPMPNQKTSGLNPLATGKKQGPSGKGFDR